MPHYGAGRTIELVGDCEDLYASALAEGFDTESEATEDLRRSLVNGDAIPVGISRLRLIPAFIV